MNAVCRQTLWTYYKSEAFKHHAPISVSNVSSCQCQMGIFWSRFSPTGSLLRTGSDRKEDPAIPGYVQLRWIWSQWISASRLHGRRQQIRRPSDQWWTWECSRRVCHEKKEKKKIWPCTPFLTSSVMSHNHTTNKPCIHQRTARQVAACRPTNSTVMFTYLWEFVIYYYLLSTLHNNAQHLLTTVCKTTAFTVIATDIIIIIIFFYPS